MGVDADTPHVRIQRQTPSHVLESAGGGRLCGGVDATTILLTDPEHCESYLGFSIIRSTTKLV